MSIRIRTSETKTSKPRNGAGKLFVYRNTYNRASEQGGVVIPAHTVVAYLGSLDRFTEPGQAVDYRDGADHLDPDETKVLNDYLQGDMANFEAAWPPKMVSACRAKVKAEFEREQELARNTVPQSDFDICANVLAGAARDVVADAATFKADNQVLADGWLREKDLTDAPGENAITQLKARANAIRKAYKEVFEPALKQAGLVQDKAAAAAAAAAKAAEGGAQ